MKARLMVHRDGIWRLYSTGTPGECVRTARDLGRVGVVCEVRYRGRLDRCERVIWSSEEDTP